MWLALVGCSHPIAAPAPPVLDPAVLGALSMARVKADVDRIAADDTDGRAPGSPGHDAVRDYLQGEMEAAGLEPAGDSLRVDVPLHLSRQRYAYDAAGALYAVPLDLTGTDLLGLRTGTDPDASAEVVLLIAHYDHLGVDPTTGEAYNGAFDDATAVAALLELARVLDEQDVRFPRTLGFLFTDAEEDGLDGAAAWANDPSFSLQDVVAALSVDPIGRPLLPDYWPLFTIGAERSPQLTAAVQQAAVAAGVEVRRLSDTPVVGYASDQDVFWALPSPVPALWITSGGMTFYHQTTDDPLTIDYRTVQDHLAVIAELAATLAGPSPRPVDLGPQPLSADDLDEAVRTLDGALGSAELTDDERALGEQFRVTLAYGAKSGNPSDGEFLVSYTNLLLYVIQQLAPAHPGPIPPPFPPR